MLEGGHAKVSVRVATLGYAVELDQFVLGASETDLQTLNFTEPPFTFRLDDPGFEVVANLLQPRTLSWLRPEHGTSNTSVLMNTRRIESARTSTNRQLATLKLSEKFIPFTIGWGLTRIRE